MSCKNMKQYSLPTFEKTSKLGAQNWGDENRRTENVEIITVNNNYILNLILRIAFVSGFVW